MCIPVKHVGGGAAEVESYSRSASVVSVSTDDTLDSVEPLSVFSGVVPDALPVGRQGKKQKKLSKKAKKSSAVADLVVKGCSLKALKDLPAMLPRRLYATQGLLI